MVLTERLQKIEAGWQSIAIRCTLTGSDCRILLLCRKVKSLQDKLRLTTWLLGSNRGSAILAASDQVFAAPGCTDVCDHMNAIPPVDLLDPMARLGDD